MLGYFLGKNVGRLAIWLRSRHQETDAPNDFLALALIALAYASAEAVGTWGFLAVFAAGIGFRRAETKTVNENPAPEQKSEPEKTEKIIETDSTPAEHLLDHTVGEEEMKHPTKAAGLVVSEIISFGDTAEWLLEVTLIVLVGICLAIYWDWRAVPLAFALFFVIRPLAAQIFLLRTPTDTKQRWLMSWFGIRGIGCLYYLSYALNHGLNKNIADAVGITLSVVALSILVHGISTQPILDLYERAISAKESKENSHKNEKHTKVRLKKF